MSTLCKKTAGILTLFLFASTLAIAQASYEETFAKLGPEPLFYVDSVKTSQAEMLQLNADSIASLKVIYDSTAVNSLGPEAIDGAILIETRGYARRKFIRFLRGVSLQYDSLYTRMGNDDSFHYLINGKLQSGNYEGNLSLLDEKLFISLEILTPEQLKQSFEIDDRRYGIAIQSNKPEILYRKDEKF